MPDKPKIPMQQMIEALLDAATPLAFWYIYRLSDLAPADLVLLQENWGQIPVRRRQAIMEDLEKFSESDPLLAFENICRFALNDEDELVRELAIRTLWECEDHDLIDVYIKILDSEKVPEVCAAAASALGKFIYLGEIEEIAEDLHRKVEDRLLILINSAESKLIRRRALEALGFSSRPEIPALIETAYHSGDHDWLVSAVFAMGRSANENWIPEVKKMFDHDSDEVRLEAVRAAGELEAKECAPLLMRLVDYPVDDVRLAAIWSLSQIGGEGVRDLLEKLYDDPRDEEEMDLIGDALDNLSFTEEFELFSILEIPDDEPDLPGESEDQD